MVKKTKGQKPLSNSSLIKTIKSDAPRKPKTPRFGKNKRPHGKVTKREMRKHDKKEPEKTLTGGGGEGTPAKGNPNPDNWSFSSKKTPK